MSAWVVGKDHIDLLVTAVVERGIKDPETGEKFEDGTTLGQVLWAENVCSVAYRYDLPFNSPEGAQYRRDVDGYEFAECPEPSGPWRAGEVLEAATASYICQSSHGPEWEGSFACQVVGALVASLGAFEDPLSAGSRRGWRFEREQVPA